MKQYIERGAALGACCEACFLYSADGEPCGCTEKEALLAIPTADVVEVVRCKDCANDGLSTCPLCYIEKHALIFINHDPEFFCAAGERRGKE